MNRQVVIKKYENRRLYDTTHSRYINLEEVAQMVKEGRDVRVVDAATGEDLTRVVLTQIIMENARDSESAFPLDVLRQMVVASGRATQENTLKYMKAMLDMYQNAYRVMAPVNPFEFMGSAGVRPSRAPAGTTPAEPQWENPEVDELRRRVKELELMVSKIGGARQPRTSRRESARTRK
jgi:polyhydroxyalkanoate synthesis repressor PhaR